MLYLPNLGTLISRRQAGYRFLSFKIPFFLCSTAMLFCGCCRNLVGSATSTADSIRVEKIIEYRETMRDTVVYITLPVQSFEVIRRDSSLLETTVATSFARIEDDGTLFHTLENNEQPLPRVIPLVNTDRVERLDSVVVRHHETVRVIKERYVPRLVWIVFAVISFAFLWSRLRGLISRFIRW